MSTRMIDKVLKFYQENQGKMFSDREIRDVMKLNNSSYVTDIRRRLLKQGHSFTTKTIDTYGRQVFGYHSSEGGEVHCHDGYRKPISNDILDELMTRMWGEINTQVMRVIRELNSERYWTYDDIAERTGLHHIDLPASVRHLHSNHGLVFHRRVIGHRKFEYRITGIEEVKKPECREMDSGNKSLLNKVFS